MISDVVVLVLVSIGSFFTVVGSIGLVRFKDYYQRLHGPTKATTLGVGSLLIASMFYFGLKGEGFRLHMLLVTLFLFLTSPVTGHLLARTGLTLRIPTETERPRNAHGHLGDGDGPAARKAAFQAEPVGD